MSLLHAVKLAANHFKGQPMLTDEEEYILETLEEAIEEATK